MRRSVKEFICLRIDDSEDWHMDVLGFCQRTGASTCPGLSLLGIVL